MVKKRVFFAKMIHTDELRLKNIEKCRKMFDINVLIVYNDKAVVMG